MRRITLVLGAAMAVAASPAVAGMYPIVIDIDESNLVAIDLDTIQEVNGYKRVWELFVTSSPKDSSKALIDNSLVEVDCSQRRRHSLGGTIYELDGTVAGKSALEAWSFSAPNTPAWDVMSALCDPSTIDQKRVREITGLRLANVFWQVRTEGKSKSGK